MNDFKANYLELESWKKWYINMVVDNPVPFKTSTRGQQPKKSHLSKRGDLNDDVALEVLQYRKNLIDFGGWKNLPFINKRLYTIKKLIKIFKINGRIVCGTSSASIESSFPSWSSYQTQTFRRGRCHNRMGRNCSSNTSFKLTSEKNKQTKKSKVN